MRIYLSDLLTKLLRCISCKPWYDWLILLYYFELNCDRKRCLLLPVKSALVGLYAYFFLEKGKSICLDFVLFFYRSRIWRTVMWSWSWYWRCIDVNLLIQGQIIYTRCFLLLSSAVNSHLIWYIDVDFILHRICWIPKKCFDKSLSQNFSPLVLLGVRMSICFFCTVTLRFLESIVA